MDDKMKNKIYAKLNNTIACYDPLEDILTHPQSHLGLTPFFMQLRGEIYCLGTMHVEKRRQKLRELLISDYLQEEKELREIDLAYIDTQP